MKKDEAHFLLLRTQTCSSVCNLNTQYLCTIQDDSAVSARDVVGDFGSETFVVHQQELNLSHVANEEFLETAREEMACLFVAAVADLGHSRLALETAPNPVIDTLGFSPCFLDAVITIRLVALEFVGALFHDGNLDGHYLERA